MQNIVKHTENPVNLPVVECWDFADWLKLLKHVVPYHDKPKKEQQISEQ